MKQAIDENLVLRNSYERVKKNRGPKRLRRQSSVTSTRSKSRPKSRKRNAGKLELQVGKLEEE
jgi:hypothetical protein